MKIAPDHIVSTTKFRAHVAEILDKVTAGQPHLIVRGSRPIALVIRPDQHREPTDELGGTIGAAQATHQVETPPPIELD